MRRAHIETKKFLDAEDAIDNDVVEIGMGNGVVELGSGGL